MAGNSDKQSLKSLAKDTAVYGVSSIVGRFLNWLLVPLYTITFAVAEYGVVTFVYSVVALALAVLTYGMETGFFRFANHERWTDPEQVYGTCLTSLAVSSSAFVLLVLTFISPVTKWMECDGNPSYIIIMAVCVALDAFLAIPYGYLRYRNKAMRFAFLKLVNIGVNIGLNIFFILLCPWLAENAPATVNWFYDPRFGIGYIFLANLIASFVNFLMMLPDFARFKWAFSARLWREIIAYSAPLLVLGVAGIMNQTIDKILYPHLVADPGEAMYGLGIYGANYKIAVLLLVFLQAFRFAYEPFIFARSKDAGESKMNAYRDAMTWFIAFALFIILGVMFYLDIIKYFISPRYFSGLKVVPLIMLGELFFGIFYNLSIWYKLTDKTKWGMWFSLGGLAVTIILNIILVPRWGYMGCAFAAMTSYALMMIASYIIGNRRYPVGYPLAKIARIAVCAAVCYALGVCILPLANLHNILNAIIRAAILCAFIAAFARIQNIKPEAFIAPMKKFIHRK